MTYLQFAYLGMQIEIIDRDNDIALVRQQCISIHLIRPDAMTQ